MSDHANVRCGFWDTDPQGKEVPCPHRAEVVANVPWLGIRIPSCTHCAHGYEIEVNGYPPPNPTSPADPPPPEPVVA